MARVYVERRDLPAHLIRLLEETRAAAECTPPMDVLETATGLEVRIDVPGVTASEIEIIFADGVLLITRQKLPNRCEHPDAGFHIAERAFGRFARAIRVEGAFDAGRAAASLTAGELRVVLPRIDERRGAHLRIPIR
jgi:HSP20 family protein